MTRARAAALLALLAGSLLTGCAKDSTSIDSEPLCRAGDDGAGQAVILMAQSVPSATQVPCVHAALPLGWHFYHLVAENGTARFWLGLDMGSAPQITVYLTRDCNVDGTTEVPTDWAGMRRLERVRQTTPTYLGERYYLFPGGCLTFTFRLSQDIRVEGLTLVPEAIGVVSRASLQAQVRKESHGRLSLDPPPGGEG